MASLCSFLPSLVRNLCCAALVVGSGCLGTADESAPRFDAGPALSPCATATFTDDGPALPVERSTEELSVTLVSASSFQRGRSLLTFETSPEVNRLAITPVLLARDHDAFVPAALIVDVDAQRQSTLPVDFYLEGPWELNVQGVADSGDRTEEVRFAFCIGR